MNNDILDQATYTKFLQAFTDRFSNHLTAQTLQTLSTLLALDYTNRLATKKVLEQHINDCITNLANNLGGQVILTEDFTTILKLFGEALSSFNETNKLDIQTKQQLDLIVGSNFPHLTRQQQQLISTAIAELLLENPELDLNELLTKQRPMLLKFVEQALVSKQLSSKQFQQQLIEVITFQQQIVHQQVRNKNLSSTFLTLIGIGLSAGLALIASPIILVAAIPAAAATAKYNDLIVDKARAFIRPANDLQPASPLQQFTNNMEQLLQKQVKQRPSLDIKLAQSPILPDRNTRPIATPNIASKKKAEQKITR